MIELYSGTPGSGKSFHAVDRIYCVLRIGKNVIANFPIAFPPHHKQRGDFKYLSNTDLTVSALIQYAREHHKPYKEHQTLIVIDEAGIKFNARNWQDRERLKWLEFFSQHRKFGYDIILISQADIMLDKQIRTFIEIQHIHRKMSNNGWVGLILSPLITFCDVKRWYGIDMSLGCDFIRYKHSIAKIYDSYAMFDNGLIGGLSDSDQPGKKE